MSLEIVTAYAERLEKYTKEKKISTLFIAFHGGEPLLADMSFYRNAVEIIRTTVSNTKIYFVLQTNGTLLNDEWCALFKELDIQVGISIDGTKEFHDKYRIYHNGKESFEEVLRGIKKRDEYGVGGLITVINPEINPVQLYEFYKTLNAKYINILLPDDHYNSSFHGQEQKTKKALYGLWLIKLYECWSRDKNDRPVISFFENIVNILLGNERGDELIGKRKNRALCIESDGAIEVVDPLRVCGNGFTKNNLNVLNNDISEIEKTNLFRLYHDGHDVLCDTCLGCSINTICGGGYLPHRYANSNGFDNPSIYCDDLKALIVHIQNDIYDCIPDHFREKLNFGLLELDKNQYMPPNDVSYSNRSFLTSFKKI